MSEIYKVVFRGEVADGFEEQKVKENLGKILKKDLTAIEKLFSGKAFVIKKANDRATCEKVQAILGKYGAICHIKEPKVATTPEEEAAPVVPPPPTPPPASPAEPAEVVKGEAESPPAPPEEKTPEVPEVEEKVQGEEKLASAKKAASEKLDSVKTASKKFAEKVKLEEKVASAKELSSAQIKNATSSIRSDFEEEGFKGALKNKFVLGGAGLFGVLLLVLLFSFIGGSSTQPPDEYLNLNLRSRYSGMGDGGTVELGVTLKEFLAALRQDVEPIWENDGDRWLMRFNYVDDATGRAQNLVFLFAVWDEEHFTGDVILERLVINNIELGEREIYGSVVDLAGMATRIRVAKSIGEALEKDDLATFKKLLKEGKDISQKELEDAYFNSVKKGNVDFLEALVGHLPDINVLSFGDRSAIEEAVYSNKPESVKFLLKKKVDPERVNRALVLAASNGFFEVFKLIADSGADINYKADRDKPALIKALYKNTEGHQQVVRYLLENNADLEVKERSKITDSAIRTIISNSSDRKRLSQDKEYLKLILKRGVDLSVEDKQNRGLFAYVVRMNDPELVGLMVDNGFNINPDEKMIEKSFSTIPLHTAVKYEAAVIIDELLKRGVDIDIQSSDGNTALHRAVQQDNIEIIETLLKNKANPNIENNGDDTVSDIARKEKLSEIGTLLKQYGAEDRIEKAWSQVAGRFVNRTGEKNGVLSIKILEMEKIELSISNVQKEGCNLKNRPINLKWVEYNKLFSGEYTYTVNKDGQKKEFTDIIDFRYFDNIGWIYRINGYCAHGDFVASK